MFSIKPNITIKEWRDFVRNVYGIHNDRDFSSWDMVFNLERFTMRGLKGIRKKDKEKTKVNLIIALSWFMSLMNQLHINIDKEIWIRFPYLCSYCGSCPCSCGKNKERERRKIKGNEKFHPKTLSEFQKMFGRIYPSEKRTLEHAGIHLAEELGEFSETILTYRGSHKKSDFEKIELEAADLFSCFAGVFNSLNISLANQLSRLFSKNCHVCKKAPCECSFTNVIKFKS